MESGDTRSTNTEQPTRRVTRRSTKEHFELKPREPLRRKRKNVEPQAGRDTAVNGSETQKRRPSTDDDEPPEKKRDLQSEDASETSEDADVNMEVQVDGDDQGSDEDDEMNSEDPHPAQLIKKSSVRLVPLKNISLSGDMVNQVDPGVLLRSRRSIHPPNAGLGMYTEATEVKYSTGSSKRSSGAPMVPRSSGQAGVIPTRPAPKQDSRTEGQVRKSSMEDYHRKLQGGPSDHVNSARRKQGVMDLNQTPNNIFHSKKTPKKGEYTKVLPKPKTKTPDKGVSSQIYTAILWLFLLCVLLCVGVLAYQRIPWSSLLNKGLRKAQPPKSSPVSLDIFSNHMSELEQRFRSQRDELWRRSRIHLQRHLQAAEHTEPVSMILTAGRRAEKTLRCLAIRLASAFSSAFNGSVLELDGVSLADKDGNQVKLDLDNQLKEAFEGDKPATVIHRLEELPPSSTLIFYRYCDHENAAYKHPLIAFTVLLPQDEVSPDLTLQEVEELVHSQVHQKFLVPDQPDTFDKMDVNKLSGLWSRISHLVLPVSMEQHVEDGDCDRS